VLHQTHIHVSECKKRSFGHGKRFAPDLLRLFGVVLPRFNRFPFSDGPAQCCAPSPDPASEQRLI